MSVLTIHTDGGARGNPGPAAIGVVFTCDDYHAEYQRHLGEGTNNMAEYSAVLEALERLPEVPCEVTELRFFLDSELVQRQIIGQYRVKEPSLQVLHQEIMNRLRSLTIPYSFTHVRREHNKEADRLVNQALDAAH
jgi:ribonuclease HI